MATLNMSGLNTTPMTGNISNVKGASITQQRSGDNIAKSNFDWVAGTMEAFVNETLPLTDIVTVQTGQKMGVNVVFDDVASAELFKMSRGEGAPVLESSYATTEEFVMQFGEKSRYMNHVWENTAISELDSSKVEQMIAKTVKKWNEEATKETLAFLVNTHPSKPIADFTGANYKQKLLQAAQYMEQSTGVSRENFICLLSPEAYDAMIMEQLGYEFPDIFHRPAVEKNPWGFQTVRVAPFGYLPNTVDFMLFIKRYTFYATGPTMPAAVHTLNDINGRPNTPRFYCEEVYEIDTYDSSAGLIVTRPAAQGLNFLMEPQIYFTAKEIVVPVGTAFTLDNMKAENGLNAIGRLINGTTEDLTDTLEMPDVVTTAPGIFEATVTCPAVAGKYTESVEVIRVNVVA